MQLLHCMVVIIVCSGRLGVLNQNCVAVVCCRWCSSELYMLHHLSQSVGAAVTDVMHGWVLCAGLQTSATALPADDAYNASC